MPAKKLTRLRNKAEKGDTKAQLDLAVRLYKGDGIKSNYEEAEKWYRLAAKNDDMNAQYALGNMYLEGAIDIDNTEACKWCRLSAQQGHSSAKSLLAFLLCDGGNGTKEDIAEAIKLYEEVIPLGDVDAMVNLAGIYRRGDPMYRNIPAAKELLFRASDLGDDFAQIELVSFFFHDKAFLADKSALDEFKKRVSVPGYERVQSELGRMYYDGGYVMQDYAEALRWYSLTADKGEPESLFYLGVMYSEGKGVEQDHVKAREWLLKAADIPYKKAQYFLGQIYAEGNGVPQDYNEALKWYRLAAKLGHHKACVALAKMYGEGVGVKRSYPTSVKWYRFAADRICAEAMYNLGVMYSEGKGVERDYDEALKWAVLAYEQKYYAASSLAKQIFNANNESMKQQQRSTMSSTPSSNPAWNPTNVVIQAHQAIKHILSLYRHAYSKHIILVPSIAAGKKLFNALSEKVNTLSKGYACRIHCFLFSKTNAEELIEFSDESEDIEILIIDVGALNPRGFGYNDFSFMYSANQEFQGRRPIDVINCEKLSIILCDEERFGKRKSTCTFLGELNSIMIWRNRISDKSQNEKLKPINVAKAFIIYPSGADNIEDDWNIAPF
jgi:TPR repeat protein